MGVWPVPSASELCSNLVGLFGISFPTTLLTLVNKALRETLVLAIRKQAYSLWAEVELQLSTWVPWGRECELR